MIFLETERLLFRTHEAKDEGDLSDVGEGLNPRGSPFGRAQGRLRFTGKGNRGRAAK
jgi:hypothetical protein